MVTTFIEYAKNIKTNIFLNQVQVERQREFYSLDNVNFKKNKSEINLFWIKKIV